MPCEPRYWIKLTIVAGGTAHATQGMEAPTIFVKENTKYTFGMTYMSHADYTDGDTTLKLQLLDSSNDILKEIIVPTKNLDKKIQRAHDYLMYMSDGVADVCRLTHLDKIKIVADDTRAGGGNRYIYVTDIFVFEGDFFARTPYGYGYGNYDSFWAIERIQLATKERVPPTPYRPGLYTEENVDLLLANKNATVTAYIRNMDAGDVVNVNVDGDIIVGTDIKGSGSLELSSGGFPIFYVDNANFYYAEALATPYYYISIDVANKIVLIGDDDCISSDSALEVVKEDITTKIRFATFSTNLIECPRIYFHKSHDGTLQTKTTTLDGENLGWLVFYGVDTGNNWDVGAVIKAVQNGAAGGRLPTDLILYTYTDGAENVNQLVLYHDGKVGIGVAIPTEKLDVDGDIQCTSGKFSEAYGIIWTDSNTAPMAGAMAGSTIYQANIGLPPGETKIRTYFVKRPWMNVIRATAEIQAAGLGTAEMRVNVGGLDGSIESTVNVVWTLKESTYDCSGLTDGTIYEILFYLKATLAGPCSMRRPVIGWSIS